MSTVIFGVDGLTFRVLHPLIERGDLPNFRKLSQEGCEAVLESKYPPLTPPAWTSLSTGLKPARHGVYDFWTYADERQGEGAARAMRQSLERAGMVLVREKRRMYGLLVSELWQFGHAVVPARQ